MNNLVKNDERNLNLLPWKIMQEEPHNAFRCFEIFLTLGTQRTLVKVAEKSGISLSKLKHWSSKWDWFARAELHDETKLEIAKGKTAVEIEIRNKKLEQKQFELSKISEIATAELMNYLNNYWAHYNNPDIRNKMNFIKNLSSTINKLMKFAKIDLNSSEREESEQRSVKINNILNLNNDVKQINIEKANLYDYNDVLGGADYDGWEEDREKNEEEMRYMATEMLQTNSNC